jgi:hypothetical protein
MSIIYELKLNSKKSSKEGTHFRLVLLLLFSLTHFKTMIIAHAGVTTLLVFNMRTSHTAG